MKIKRSGSYYIYQVFNTVVLALVALTCIFPILLSLIHIFLLLLNRVQAEGKKRSELELKVVLGKINPHFLYNTLDTLKWYAAGKKDREMVHFITSRNFKKERSCNHTELV